MRSLFLAFLTAAGLAALSAGPAEAQRPNADEIVAAAATPTGLVEALYRLASFDPGPEPDWDLFRHAFLDDAIIVFARSPQQPMRPLGVDGFLDDWRAFFRDRQLEDKGFYEGIGGMKVVEFGGIAHAFVIFEPWIGPDEPERKARGLDSIEMAFDGERWWIAAITTDFERPGTPIPDIGG